KEPEAVQTVLDLVENADVLIEGMRPGVAERLGLGPYECHIRNPRLVYGRMTGWGQDGPWSRAAGHDMNYIAITGTLHGLGQVKEKPQFPTNLVGDFGGGSTYLVIGVLAALLEARTSGKGQVIDAAIVDGTAHLNAIGAVFHATGIPGDQRVSGLLDGGMPYYDVYETADGRHLSVAPLEGRFYEEFLDLLGLAGEVPDRNDFAALGDLRTAIAARIKERTQSEWVAKLEGTDACVAGIIPLAEAFEHPHNKAREVYVDRDGLVQPAPAPRFSRTAASLTTGPSAPGDSTREALAAWGIDDVDALIDQGVAVQA
ncbi:MAG TPA: CaiB/BaiF CoA-transferase family protein, partial [Marmoricola sp.]|nr:CaiB/BaiF CoA-transferase family protein [Marmoricola sp.]